jgi:hypothetical protein
METEIDEKELDTIESRVLSLASNNSIEIEQKQTLYILS